MKFNIRDLSFTSEAPLSCSDVNDDLKREAAL